MILNFKEIGVKLSFSNIIHDEINSAVRTVFNSGSTRRAMSKSCSILSYSSLSFTFHIYNISIVGLIRDFYCVKTFKY